MLNLFYIANNIIERGKSEGIAITPMKLQKLLYLIYREYIKKYNKPLFSERFEAWQFGPVLDSIYHEFKKYKANAISSFYKDDDGKVFKISENECPEFKEVFNSIWSKYKNIDPIELSNRTHQRGSAWDKSIINDTCVLSDNDIINEEWE
jgi:uncharacterized phage-associated protein